MWTFYSVPLWRMMLAWWRGQAGEPVVMRRVVDGTWQTRPLTAEDHAERRRLGVC